MTVAPHFRAPGGSYAPVMLARTVPKRFVSKGCTNFYVAKSSHLMVVKQDGEALSICIQVDAPDTVKQENNTAQPLTSDV